MIPTQTTTELQRDSHMKHQALTAATKLVGVLALAAAWIYLSRALPDFLGVYMKPYAWPVIFASGFWASILTLRGWLL